MASRADRAAAGALCAAADIAGSEILAVTAPVAKLHLVDTTAMRIERGLRALTDCIGDEAIPAATRKELALAHAALHRCRDARTVAQMEHEQGIGPQDAA